MKEDVNIDMIIILPQRSTEDINCYFTGITCRFAYKHNAKSTSLLKCIIFISRIKNIKTGMKQSISDEN